MPEMYPLIKPGRFVNSDGAIGFGAQQMPEYSCDGVSQYGYYGSDVGFVLNQPIVFVDWQQSGPNLLVFAGDLGYTDEITIYYTQDLVGRTIGPEPSPLLSDTCWADETTPVDRTLEAIWFQPGTAAWAGYFFPFGSVNIPTGQRLARTVGFAGSIGQDTNVQSLTLNTGNLKYYQLKNSALYFTDGASGAVRTLIVGMLINGVLYGTGVEGETNEERGLEAQTLVEGTLWWRDLQNAVQSPSAFDSQLSIGNTGSFEQGYNYVKGLIESGAYSSAFEVQSVLQQVIDVTLPGSRTLFGMGARDLAAVNPAIDDYFANGTPIPLPDISASAIRYGWTYGTYDAFQVLGLYDIEAAQDSTPFLPATDGFLPPTLLDQTASPFLELYEQYYLAGYNGALEGFAAGFDDEPSNPSEGQTGSAGYNSAWLQGYSGGYTRGTDLRTGAWPDTDS